MNISADDERFRQIARIAARSPFSDVAMWRTFQEHVRENIHQFAGEGFYLTQDYPIEEYERAAKFVRINKINECPMRDVQFGAKAVHTSLGPVCRAGLDAIIEAEFIKRKAPLVETVLDIGAGYGRLARVLYHWFFVVRCIDAVPISTYLCEKYLEGTSAKVLTLDQIPPDGFEVDLAINVHSWSECSIPQIARWLGTLQKVPYLFTVAHDREYSSWCGPSFRPLLESQYELMGTEEFNAVQRDCPHAMWRRRGI